MKKQVIFLLVSTLFAACHKGDIPGCINREIKNFDKNHSCGSAKVDEYRYQDRKVYVFDPGICGADMTSTVIDENCNVMGSLGGITGNTTIHGESFSNAVFLRNVWKK